jgi:hypothetical protein
MPDQPTERAYHQLSTAEQFVLGVCRCWDAFAQGPDPAVAWHELAPVFFYMDVPTAMCAFEHVFDLLRRLPAAALRFQDTDCEHVGGDEARLLGSLACLQRGQARAAVNILRGSPASAWLRALLPPLARIAAILDARGHRLPLWRDTAAYSEALLTPRPRLSAWDETSWRPQFQAR